MVSVSVLANDIEPGKEFYNATLFAKAPVIDGNLADWAGVPVLSDPRFAIPKGSGTNGTYVIFEPYNGGIWSGPDDWTSAFQIGWDPNNLYLGVTVTDDSQESLATGPTSCWNGDSVQLMVADATRSQQIALFDYGLGGEDGALGDTYYWDEAGPAADASYSGPDTQVVIKRDTPAQKTYYEIQIPAAAMGFTTLSNGMKIGLGVCINNGDVTQPGEPDQTGQKGWGGWGPHSIVFGKSPSECGLLTLTTNLPTVDRLFIGDILPGIDTFSFRANNQGTSIASTNGATLTLDGQSVPLTATPSSSGDAINFAYQAPAPLPPLSSHTYTIVVQDTDGNSVTSTGTFVTQNYLMLSADQAVSDVDTGKPGFRFRLWELSKDTYNWLGYDLENTIARAAEELAGMRGPNDADTNGTSNPSVVFNDNGYYDESGVINYSLLDASATPAAAGDFQANASDPSQNFPDAMIPGLNYLTSPATASQAINADNTAAEVLTYLYFPEAGLYKIVVNSDDGFRLTTSPNPQEVLNSTIVSQYDGGRGSSDTTQTIGVPAKGYWGFRVLYFNGGGDANLEWSGNEISPHPSKFLLLNDPNSVIKAYRDVTSPGPAAVSFIDPTRDTGGPWRPDVEIQAQVVDGASPVSGIQMTLNGQSVTPTTSKSGNVTKVTYQPPTPLASGSTNQVVLSFTSGSQDYVGTNTFVAAQVANVPPSLALPASAVDTSKPGFLVKSVQADYGLDNTVWRATYELAGLIGWPNTSDLSQFTGPDNSYVDSTTVNWNGGGTSAGYFTGSDETDVPGMPGSAATNGQTNNYAMQVLTVLNLQPGYYIMGVSSDDGCQVTFGNPIEARTLPIGSLDTGGVDPRAFSLPVAMLTANYGRGMDGSSDAQYFHISQAGYYPVRLLYFQGGGGYGCEWYTRDLPNTASANSGALTYLSRHLINDSSDSASIAAYQYPASSPGSPYISGYGPAPTGSGDHTAANAAVWANMVQGAGTLPGTNQVSLTVDGSSVTPVVTPEYLNGNQQPGNTLAVKYQPANDWSAGMHTVSMSLGDRTLNWTFTVPTNAMPAVPTFDIEAEDYDTGGGQSQAAANQMPYAGGAYVGLDAELGVDYERADQASSEIYRSPSMSVHTPAFINQDFSRGDGEISYNYRLGYIGGGQWYNYTRTFPDGTYNVYAGISNGSAAGTPHGEYAQLQMVTAGQGTTNQTVQTLGTFDAPATGAWGLNALVPLKDANGNLASVALSGKQTLRYNLPLSATNVVGSVTNVTPSGNGDWDFMVFVPASSSGARPKFTNVKLSGGNIVLEWTGSGTLQSAPAVTGPWTDVAGATSPYSSDTSSAKMTYYRIQQ